MVFDFLKFAFICLEVVLIFNLLIVVHELGHFLAARWRGLVVEKFAIWFGKPIWSKTIDGVEYRLGSIPAGGFVAIPQLAPMEVLEGEELAVKGLFGKIEQDSRHTLVSVIQEGEISTREYPSWAMTFYNPQTEEYEHVGSPIQWQDKL